MSGETRCVCGHVAECHGYSGKRWGCLTGECTCTRYQPARATGSPSAEMGGGSTPTRHDSAEPLGAPVAAGEEDDRDPYAMSRENTRRIVERMKRDAPCPVCGHSLGVLHDDGECCVAGCGCALTAVARVRAEQNRDVTEAAYAAMRERLTEACRCRGLVFGGKSVDRLVIDALDEAEQRATEAEAARDEAVTWRDEYQRQRDEVGVCLGKLNHALCSGGLIPRADSDVLVTALGKGEDPADLALRMLERQRDRLAAAETARDVAIRELGRYASSNGRLHALLARAADVMNAQHVRGPITAEMRRVLATQADDAPAIGA